MKKILAMMIIFTVAFPISTACVTQAYGWAGRLFPDLPQSLHGMMTHDALEGLDWDEGIEEILKFADLVDYYSPHCENSNHRVEKYQEEFQDYNGAPCALPGAEHYASTHIKLARRYYGDDNKDEGQWNLGRAIHYIQDAVCPPHVFPFKEGLLGSHTDFEAYTASAYVLNLKNWQSLVRDAPIEPISSPEDLRTKINRSAKWVRDLPCSYIRQDGTKVVDPIEGDFPVLDLWKMSDENIGLCMQEAASLAKGAANYALFGPEPIKIDTVLVIDRSGSMGGSKIFDAKASAEQLVDLMMLGDKIGIVSFASNVRIDHPLSEIISPLTKLDVKDKINLIHASGMTAMGDGLRTAYNQLVNYGDSSHPWTIVLLSNGWHNYGTEHPYSVIPDLKSKDIKVCTIGLGAGADSYLLGYIASETGGIYRFAPTSEDLLAIYNDIAARVAEAQIVSSALASVAQGETTQLSIGIDSSITQATFTISWGGSDLDLTLIRPDDMLIDPDIAAIDPDIDYVEEERYEIYRVNYPMSGTWQMVVTGVDVPIEGESLSAQVTALTGVTLSLATNKESYTYPEPVKIIVQLEDLGDPLTGADVTASVTRPDASEISLTLFDDGLDIHGDLNPNDGIYTNYFEQFTEDGSYTIKVMASGTTIIEDNFNREDKKTVLISGVPFDITPPKTMLFIGSPQYIDEADNIYVTSNTPFTLSAVDNNGAGSGVDYTTYRIYNEIYDTGWLTYTAPFKLTGLEDGAYNIDYKSIDNAGNVEPTNTYAVILDNTGPSVTILNPPIGAALQDEVTFIASAIDSGSGVESLNLSIREANDGEGTSVGFEDLPANYDSTTGEWTLFFDTLLLPDGYYVVLAKAKDNLGNIGPSTIVSYSIRNWAVIELLPASENNKAGRTMPVKFALRVVASVDPLQPSVYNEELTIRVYTTNNPDEILQESTFGDTARDYRIDTISEHYITNFRTLKTPLEYTVMVCRDTFEIGSFTFETIK